MTLAHSTQIRLPRVHDGNPSFLLRGTPFPFSKYLRQLYFDNTGNNNGYIWDGYKHTGYLGALIFGTTAAGLWAKHTLTDYLTSLDDPDREKNEIVEAKFGADIKTYADTKSEHIMAYVLEDAVYSGAILGEEGIVRRPSRKLVTVLDGIDGTENAVKLVEGASSSWGPLAGMFEIVDNRIKAVAGAGYIPSLKRGFAGSIENKIAIEFSVYDGDESCFFIRDPVVLQPFRQDRTSLFALMGIWQGAADEGIPDWANNLYKNLNAEKQQRALHTSVSPSLYYNLFENYPSRFMTGASVSVSSPAMLHDIMWAIPMIEVLGGVVGNAQGILYHEKGFFPEYYVDQTGKRIETGGLKEASRSGMLPKVPIGPIIAAQNEELYRRTLDYMKK